MGGVKPSDVVSEPWRLWKSVNTRDKAKTAAGVAAGVAASGTMAGPPGAAITGLAAGLAWMGTDVTLIGVGKASAALGGGSRFLRGGAAGESLKRRATPAATKAGGVVGAVAPLVAGYGVGGAVAGGLSTAWAAGSVTYVAADAVDAVTHAVDRHRDLADEEPGVVSAARAVGQGVADGVRKGVSTVRGLVGGEDGGEERRDPDGGVEASTGDRGLVTDELEPRVAGRETGERTRERSGRDEG